MKVVSSDNATVTKTLTVAVANLTPTPLDDADCPTANFCIAVDRKAKAYTRTAATGWSAGMDMAGVPQSAMYQNRVSCASDTYCIYLTNAGKAAQFDGTIVDPAPGPARGRLLLGHRLRLADQLRRRRRAVQLHDRRPLRLRRQVGRHRLGRGDRHANNNGWTRVSCPTADDCMLTGPGGWARFDGTTVTPCGRPGARRPDARLHLDDRVLHRLLRRLLDEVERHRLVGVEPRLGRGHAALQPDRLRADRHVLRGGRRLRHRQRVLWTYDGSTWTEGPRRPR